MLYREIIAVCSQIHTKHINTLGGQNVEFLKLNLAVYTVTTGLRRDTTQHNTIQHNTTQLVLYTPAPALSSRISAVFPLSLFMCFDLIS